jgi:hypothetical protein
MLMMDWIIGMVMIIINIVPETETGAGRLMTLSSDEYKVQD